MSVKLADVVVYLKMQDAGFADSMDKAEARVKAFVSNAGEALKSAASSGFSKFSENINNAATSAATSAQKMDALRAAIDKAEGAVKTSNIALAAQKSNLAILETQLNSAKTKYAEIGEKLEAAKNAADKNQDSIKKLSDAYSAAGKAVDSKQMSLNNLNVRIAATESKLNTANTALNTAKDRYKTAGDAAATAATQKEKTAKSAEHVGTATSNARAGIDKMRDGLKNVETQAHTTEGALQKFLNGALGRIGSLATEGFARLIEKTKDAGVAAIKLSADYEQTMNVLQAVSGATDAQMAKVGKTAKALGADLTLPATSATGAAKAITELAKGGLSLDEAMKAAKGTLQLATIGMMDEAKAAEITSAALNMFGLKGEEAGRVTNLLAAAANASSGDVKDFADSLRMGGSVAAMAKVPIQDFTTAAALMAQQGIKGSDAGTSLKTMFLALQSPTDKAAALMSSYGISVYDAQGKMKPLPDIMRQFSTALSDNATQLVTVGGATKKQATDAGKAAEAQEKLTAAIGFGNRQLEIAQRELAGMSGKAKVSQTAIDAKKLSVDKLKASLADKNEKLTEANGKIDAYAKATGTTREAVVKMTQEQRNQTLATIFGTDAVRAANAVLMSGEEAWNEMSAAVNKAGAAEEAASAQMKGLNGAVEGLKSQLKTVALTLGEPLLKPLAAGVNAVSEFVGKAGKAFDSFGENLKVFKDPLDAVKQVLLTTFSPSTWGAIENGITVLKNLRDWAERIPAALEPFRAIAQNLFEKILPIALAESGNRFNAFKLAVDTAITLATTVIATLEPVVMTVFTAVSNFLDKHGAEIVGFLSSAWDKINAIVKGAAEIVSIVITTVFGSVARFLSTHGKEIENILTNAWTAIKIVIDTVLKWINGTIQTALKILKGDWSGAFEEVKKTTHTIMQAIIDLMGLAFRNISKALSDWYTNWKKSWTDALNEAERVVRVGMQNAKALINKVLDDIIALVQSFVGQFSSAGANMIEGFIGGVRSKAQALIDAVGGVIKGAINVVSRLLDEHSPSRVFFAKGGNSIQGFINGVLNKSGSLNEAMKSTITSATNVLIGEGASWGEISKSVTATISEIRAKARAEFDATHQITKTTTKAQRQAIEAEWNAISKTIGDQGENIRATAKVQWEAMKGDQAAAGKAIKSDQKDIWGDIADMIGEFTDEIRKTTLQDGFEAIRKEGSKFTRELSDDTSDVWRELSAAVTAKAKEMREAVVNGSKEQKAEVEAAIKEMRANAQEKWREMTRDVRDASKEIRDNVAETYKEMREEVADKLDIIKKTAEREWQAAKDAATKAIAEAKKNNISDFSAIEAALKAAGERIYDNAQKAYSDLKDKTAQKLAEFKRNNQESWDAVRGITSATVKDIVDNVLDGFGKLEKNGGGAISRFTDGVKTGMDVVKNAATGAANAVATATNTIVSSVARAINSLEDLQAVGGIGGISGGTYTPSQAFQDLFTTPTPTATFTPTIVSTPGVATNPFFSNWQTPQPPRFDPADFGGGDKAGYGGSGPRISPTINITIAESADPRATTDLLISQLDTYFRQEAYG